MKKALVFQDVETQFHSIYKIKKHNQERFKEKGNQTNQFTDGLRKNLEKVKQINFLKNIKPFYEPVTILGMNVIQKSVLMLTSLE